MKYELKPYLRSAIAWDVRTGSIQPDEGIITFRASELISDVEEYVQGKVAEALKSNAGK